MVLIAGAGPVGLAAANVLADAGVEVTVLEAEPRLPENLRASTFQPPTLDYLARFGATQRLIEMGRVAPRLQYRDRQGWVAQFDFGVIAADTQHPYRVQCEQFKLNQVLAQRLSGFPNARLEFSSPVTDVRQDEGSVTVLVDGKKELEGQWLIGADGGRSRVREALGIKLDGFTWPERFLVASTPFEFAEVIPNLCDVSYFADPEEWFFLLRVPGVWRVMFPVRPEEKDEDVLADESIQRRLNRIHPLAHDYEIRHRTLYSVHQRVAQTYRKGRCFLAGDAAHLNNPLGGMGMNGGIHDGINIAEKLVAVIADHASSSELDRYERQRRPVALEYVNKITIANKRNLEARDPAEHRRWKDEMTRTAADPMLAREYMLKTSMIASLRRFECE
ncbi:MAG TPA: FAD-dependent monooxygenase [Burkholderiales bacterium]|nr:FAD-dependent monooxygenase [Burkholderiales bacterium]